LAKSLLFALVAAAANIIGGLMVTRKTWAHRSLRYFIAVGSGFMLGTVFLEMIPESAQVTELAKTWPMLLIAGYMIVHFFEHTFAAHLHFGEETHYDEMSPALGVSAFIGMLVHTLFDGVAIGAGFSVSPELGVLVFVAMFLHKIPDGFTIASIVQSTGHSPARALAASALLGVATLVGVIAFHVTGARAEALPLAAGCTLYVAATDLMPEVNREHGVKMALLVFAGMGLFSLTEFLLERVGVAAL
jgi:ZIP family zinc transporter/zinc and cadmium transporter